MTPHASAEVTVSSVWSVPKWRAMRPARVASLNAVSAKPIEKVLTGRDDCLCSNSTMVEESMPPDRNAPTGTSDSNYSRSGRGQAVNDLVIGPSQQAF